MAQVYDSFKRDYKFKRGYGLVAAANRSGIRACAFWEALQSVEQLQEQKVQVDKPTVMIQSAKIITECRSSAKDMALTEILFAVARAKGMNEKTHEVSGSLLMKLLQIDSVDRLIDALVRIVQTVVVYDFKLPGARRKKGARSLISFDVEHDDASEMKAGLKVKIKSDTATLSFSISDEIRALYVAPKQYTWISLAAIALFKSMYTNAVYQWLASEAHKAEFMKPVTIEIEVQDLAKKVGWSHADVKPFNAPLFIERVIHPALIDLVAHIDLVGFDVDLLPLKRLAGRGRPLAPLMFKITQAGGIAFEKDDRARRKNDRLPLALIDYLEREEESIDPTCFPTISTFSLLCREWRLKKTDEELWNYRSVFFQRTQTPTVDQAAKLIDQCWRNAVERAYRSPGEPMAVDRIGNPTVYGYELVETVDSLRYGKEPLDKLFIRFIHSHDFIGMNNQVRYVPPPKVSFPDEMIFKKFTYEIAHKMLMTAGKEKISEMDVYALRTFFEVYSIVPELINIAPDGYDFSSAAHAFKLLLKAHPSHVVSFSKAIFGAILVNDFQKLHRTVRAIFAKKAVLDIDPKTGKREGQPSKVRFKSAKKN